MALLCTLFGHVAGIPDGVQNKQVLITLQSAPVCIVISTCLLGNQHPFAEGWVCMSLSAFVVLSVITFWSHLSGWQNNRMQRYNNKVRHCNFSFGVFLSPVRAA